MSGENYTLCSDVHFERNEGLYWDNVLTAPKGANVEEDMKREGFRVYYEAPRTWVFDQDFLPSAQLLKKAAWLAGWRPHRD